VIHNPLARKGRAGLGRQSAETTRQAGVPSLRSSIPTTQRHPRAAPACQHLANVRAAHGVLVNGSWRRVQRISPGGGVRGVLTRQMSGVRVPPRPRWSEPIFGHCARESRSRSARNTRFSRRNRTGSSRSALVTPGLSPASTASAANQFRRHDSEIFRSRPAVQSGTSGCRHRRAPERAPQHDAGTPAGAVQAARTPPPASAASARCPGNRGSSRPAVGCASGVVHRYHTRSRHGNRSPPLGQDVSRGVTAVRRRCRRGSGDVTFDVEVR
jgi:hypothetical protein